MAALLQPGETALNEPTYWYRHESAQFISFGYLNIGCKESFFLVSYGFSSIVISTLIIWTSDKRFNAALNPVRHLFRSVKLVLSTSIACGKPLLSTTIYRLIPDTFYRHQNLSQPLTHWKIICIRQHCSDALLVFGLYHSGINVKWMQAAHPAYQIAK